MQLLVSSSDWITEVSKDSAKYFIDVPEHDDANIPTFIRMLSLRLQG